MCEENFEDAIQENTDSDGIIHWENIKLPRLDVKGKIKIEVVNPKN